MPHLILSESRNLRFGVMTLFYFAQGLPIGLFVVAMAAWLASNGATEGDIAMIVSFSYLPWSFKFIGAALMDRYTFLAMGRRRIWLIGAQSLMVVGLIAASLTDPGFSEVALISWIGFVIFCGSAMQDVAIDGMAVDILPDAEQGPASAFMFGGQALGIAGGGALGGYMLATYGAGAAFTAFIPVVGGILLVGILMRERPGERLLPWTKGEASSESREAHGTEWLRILAITFKSILKRDSLLYLVSNGMLRTVAGAFVAFWPMFATSRAGYETFEYSSMLAIVGLIGSVSCMAIGTLLNVKLGPKLASMITFAGYGLISGVYLLAPDVAAIGAVFVAFSLFWNMTETLCTVCTNPIRMRLSEKRVAATQFTIYNSLGNLPIPIGASLFAWASGVGGSHVLMPILIVLIVLAIGIMSMLRIGKPVDHEEDAVPRVD